MGKDVKIYVQKCKRCFIAKEPHIKLKAEMCHLLASRPLDIVSIDFTVLEKSTSGKKSKCVGSYENVF